MGLLAPSGPAAALLGSGPGDVAEVLPWESARFAGLLDEGGLEDAIASQRLRRYDVALVYTRNPTLTRGVGRLVSRLVQHDPDPPPAGPHAAAWLAACLPAIGVPVGDDAIPILAPSADDQARAAAIAALLPPRFLAIHPGSGSPVKNWPSARFAAMVRALGATRWLLVRGPADDAAAAALEAVPGATVARDLPLRVLAAVLARAGAYVGNDSGVTHLAAASGAPTVALFGPTDSRVWGPVGPRVELLCGAAMDGIAVEEAAAAVTRVQG